MFKTFDTRKSQLGTVAVTGIDETVLYYCFKIAATIESIVIFLYNYRCFMPLKLY